MIRNKWNVIFVALAIAIISYVSGCQYTIEGNPDIDLTEVHLSPTSATVPYNGSLVLYATVLGFSHTSSVSWSVVGGPNNGIITANGLSAIYTAPVTPTALHQFAIVQVTSDEDQNRSASDTIFIVGANNAIAISPIKDTLLAGSVQQFSVDTFTAPPPLFWKIVSGAGSISDSGLFTAPANVSPDGSTTVIEAVSQLDSTQFTQATITIYNPIDSMICFTRDILPILSSNCGMSGCHDASTHAAGYNYNTYGGFSKSIVPGNARGSRTYTAITQFNVNNRMPPPPSQALSPNQVLKIGEWIDEGAVDCQ